MIQIDLERLPLDTLKRIYESMSFKLKAALINGESWREMNDQRDMVTALCKAIHQKDPTYLLSAEDLTLETSEKLEVPE